MKKTTLLTVIATLVLSCSACVNFRHDVSRKKDAWDAYHTGETYALRQDVFLIRVDSGLEPNRLALVPPSTDNRGSGFHASPRSIAEYEQDPVASTSVNYQYFTNVIEVVGIVSSDTQFTPRSVKRNSGWDIWFGNHTYDTMYGEILTGEFKGTLVDIEDISWWMKEEDMLNQYIELKRKD